MISGAGFFVGAFMANSLNKINAKNQTANLLNINEIKKEDPKPIETTIYFVGDIMMTRGVETSVNKNFGGDFNKLFENLSELKEADILFGNLEGAVSDKGNNVGSKYSFRMKPEVLDALLNAPFDIVSFANNHVGDWNMSAFKDTIARLDNIGIKRTGAGINKYEAVSPTIINKNGINFGFLGFSDVGPNWIEAKEDTAGILLASDPNIESIIGNAKSNVDVLIISFHFGEEYKTIHNKRQETLAHLAIDSGADMVIGHHPHVMEDIEWYKEKPIVYSLGNFIFDQYFSQNTMEGMLFIANFENKKLKNTETKTIKLNKLYQPDGIFEDQELKEIKDKEEIISSLCPKPNKDYGDQKNLNVGQEKSLPDKDYTPSSLVEIDKDKITKNMICLIQEARDSFEEMAKDAKKEGLTIKVTSGFRSYSYQDNLFASAILSGKKDVNISIAKAGYSEHQLGTAIDVTSASIGYKSAVKKFGDTEEFKWLFENSYKYGFIMSYPEGKEDITGYKYEPWHYRYIGIDNAKYIKENNLTITEFLK